MSEPIIFRVWDKENKEMMYPPLADLEDLYVRVIDGEIYSYDSDCWLAHEKCKDRFELMLFAGILDRKSRKIFKDDIIEIDMYGRYVVEFCNGAFIVECLEKRCLESFMFNPYLLINGVNGDNVNPEVKIIGNIFEHPELLEMK